ncbi:hypothetical protein CEXT_559101 [Caerostris extrusa]|uniref:Uncharacterized protein n=1 Tax=Caerostris extrusa TaxID=172846 RepID=A0AAV4WSN1_CAEEX|nr:hypothetical protein CEXT_559101 [Caerostris extrusa]
MQMQFFLRDSVAFIEDVHLLQGGIHPMNLRLNKESNEVVAQHPIVKPDAPFPVLWGFPVHGDRGGISFLLQGRINSVNLSWIKNRTCCRTASSRKSEDPLLPFHMGFPVPSLKLESPSFSGTYKLCEALLDKESNAVVASHPIVNREIPFPVLWGFPVHGDRKGVVKC